MSAILQVSMYAFALEGYPPAFDAVATDPTLHDVLSRSSWYPFGVGNITMFAGFSLT